MWDETSQQDQSRWCLPGDPQAEHCDYRDISVCKWEPDFEGYWGTTCGNLFEFTNGGPEKNGFYFCPYCGRKIASYKETKHENTN